MPVNQLSPRQEEIAVLFAEGYNHADVCKALRIKPNTLRKYIMVINLKWGCNGRTQIAIKAWEKGLVSR